MCVCVYVCVCECIYIYIYIYSYILSSFREIFLCSCIDISSPTEHSQWLTYTKTLHSKLGGRDGQQDKLREPH